MDYVALDLETTGFDGQRDAVIEVGAVAFDLTGAVNGTLERLANPGRRIPDAVVRLTGITGEDVRSAAPSRQVMDELGRFLRGRRAVGHGAALDVDFMEAAGIWEPGRELLDTLHLARILLPNAASHSLPMLAAELGLDQPRPHRALNDADATRQLLLELRRLAAQLEEDLKEKILALVAPYDWAVASFFAEALTQPGAAPAVRRERPLERLQAGPRPRAAQAALGAGALAGLLGPDGPLAASLPEYEHREAQAQMLLAVVQTLARGGTLVVEAGTGTGKSLAYLVPAIARAVTAGERVVVSTNTHTLQEQLMTQDLPGLREWLPFEFEACLLKGRPNYMSLRRWRRYLAEPCANAEELCFKLKILVWLDQTDTGDRSEMRLQGREEVLWARIASDPLDCVGLHCTAADCFVHRARAEAERADVVVVNHALLLADAQSGNGVLPHFEHLVVDEAHHLEDAATQGLRQELEGAGLEALLARLADRAEGSERVTGLLVEVLSKPSLFAGGEGADRELEAAQPLALRSRERSAALFEACSVWVRDRLAEVPRRDEQVRLVPELREAPAWGRVRDLAADTVTVLAALDSHLRRAVAAGREWLGGEEPDAGLREVEIIRGRLAEAAELLRTALVEPDPNAVHWFALAARTGSPVLRSAPLEVGPMLREQVYEARRSVIFTSASLAVGGSFEHFMRRAGVRAGAETMVLESPFDYLRQALVCLPTDMPEPGLPGFDEALAGVVADVAARIGGRTLVLFTSHQQLRDTHQALRHRHDLDEVLILGQGIDGQRRQVLKTFTESNRAVLLGTSSFWEGVDVPGDRLSCVVIVRLPFPVPTEPVFAARAERVRDAFAGYALPVAALRLKQGFGRLIRRRSDRGAVVILDNRISSREYGRAFLDVLPPASRFRGPVGEVGGRVEAWLAEREPLPV